MSKIDYTLWPNANGTLGQNKVQIPDGVTTMWPEGDALVDNFVYNGGELVGFVDTKALINNSSKTSTINYDFVKIHLENIGEGDIAFNLGERCKNFNVTYGSTFAEEVFKYKGCTTVDEVKAVDPDYLTNDIVDGVWSEGLGDLTDGYEMFTYCSNLTTFSSDLSSLIECKGMFYNCYNLTTFSSDLSSLTNGISMFYYCSKLKSFNIDLPSLTDGDYMFYGCSNLTSFNIDLPSLTNGNSMFAWCSKLNSFNIDLPSLTSATSMFLNCSNLKSFSSNLSSLTNGNGMFYNCYNLTTFSSDLRSLTNGSNMFDGCKLDTASVQNIADTINTYNGIIHVGIGNSTPNEEENAAFEQMHNKGWNVHVNGSLLYGTESGSCCCATCCASLSTLDENGEETTETPIPYWAKPVPATKETAEFVDANGNYYNVLGAQFIYVSDPETYGMFTSREDAIANMRLKRIGEEEIETA